MVVVVVLGLRVAAACLAATRRYLRRSHPPQLPLRAAPIIQPPFGLVVPEAVVQPSRLAPIAVVMAVAPCDPRAWVMRAFIAAYACWPIACWAR